MPLRRIPTERHVFQVKETLVPFKQAADLGAHDFHRVLAQGFALGFEVGSALGCLFQPVLGELAGFNALEGFLDRKSVV